jgi:hypothetical protein
MVAQRPKPQSVVVCMWGRPTAEGPAAPSSHRTPDADSDQPEGAPLSVIWGAGVTVKFPRIVRQECGYPRSAGPAKTGGRLMKWTSGTGLDAPGNAAARLWQVWPR